jgi:hypothetical protein
MKVRTSPHEERRIKPTPNRKMAQGKLHCAPLFCWLEGIRREMEGNEDRDNGRDSLYCSPHNHYFPQNTQGTNITNGIVKMKQKGSTGE